MYKKATIRRQPVGILGSQGLWSHHAHRSKSRQIQSVGLTFDELTLYRCEHRVQPVLGCLAPSNK